MSSDKKLDPTGERTAAIETIESTRSAARNMSTGLTVITAPVKTQPR